MVCNLTLINVNKLSIHNYMSSIHPRILKGIKLSTNYLLQLCAVVHNRHSKKTRSYKLAFIAVLNVTKHATRLREHFSLVVKYARSGDKKMIVT